MSMDHLQAVVMESTISIEKLTRVYFTIWRSKMEDILTLRDLQLLIHRKSKKPSSMSHEDWEKLDRKTIATIGQYLLDTVYFHVSQEKSIESLWKKLHDLYERDIVVNNMFLMKCCLILK